MDGIALPLAALVDTLLPGDEDFPPASSIGTHRLLADRIRARYGEQKLQDILDLITACGGPLEPLDGNARVEAVRRLEREHGGEFAQLRNIAYLSYYESADVIQVIKSLGHDYHAAPQPEGYRLAAFDPARDAPAHKRGHYIATDAVSPVHIKEKE